MHTFYVHRFTLITAIIITYCLSFSRPVLAHLREAEGETRCQAMVRRPNGDLLHSCGKSPFLMGKLPFLMGKSTINGHVQ